MSTTVARGPRPAGIRGKPVPPGSPPSPAPLERGPGLDVLAEEWWVSFEAADRALRAAHGALSAEEIAQRGHRLAAERAEIIRLLRELSRDLHQRSRLVDWLAAPSVTPRMLGLPTDVAVCIFDLDGVLTTSAEVHAAAWTETFDRFLLEQADLHHRPFIAFDPRHDYDLVAARLRRDGVRSFLASRGIDLPEGRPDDPPGATTVYGLANRKNQLLRLLLERQGVAAFAGSRDYLAAAGIARLRRVVVSPSANTASILEHSGLARLVDLRIDGEAAEAKGLRPKPAPDMLLAACAQLGIDPRRAAAFETSTAGVLAARAAGVGLVVGVDRGGESELLRASDADVVVQDLTDLLAVTG